MDRTEHAGMAPARKLLARLLEQARALGIPKPSVDDDTLNVRWGSNRRTGYVIYTSVHATGTTTFFNRNGVSPWLANTDEEMIEMLLELKEQLGIV